MLSTESQSIWRATAKSGAPEAAATHGGGDGKMRSSHGHGSGGGGSFRFFLGAALLVGGSGGGSGSGSDSGSGGGRGWESATDAMDSARWQSMERVAAYRVREEAGALETTSEVRASTYEVEGRGARGEGDRQAKAHRDEVAGAVWRGEEGMRVCSGGERVEIEWRSDWQAPPHRLLNPTPTP